jgi:phenol hydroxylase P1 protein
VQVDIKSVNIKPLRHTFDQVARRIGADKPASRYLEATLELQPEVNFHYRPQWDPDHEIYDKRRTAIVMEDWYALLDPRQYYYGSWTMTRARQQDAAERNFEFVTKRNLLDNLTPQSRKVIETFVLPLRHLEYAANLNNCHITAYGYGTAVTQAAMMCAQDRLGIAQYLTRIGLLLDGNSGAVLQAAKTAWQSDPVWQPMRDLAETLLVTKDWFELYLAQNFALDGLVYPLIYEQLDVALTANGGSAFSMLTEFMGEWYEEHVRWVDQTIKVAAGESAQNKSQLQQWLERWGSSALAALQPVARQALGDKAEAALADVAATLGTRAERCGLKA